MVRSYLGTTPRTVTRSSSLASRYEWARWTSLQRACWHLTSGAAVFAATVFGATSWESVRADEGPAKKAAEQPAKEAPAGEQPAAGAEKPAEAPLADPPGFRRLSKTHRVWINAERRMVIVDGRVCLRQGSLEMLACPQRTKEHEAIVAVFSDAMTVHAGLLAVGGKSGAPVQFAPAYKAATGSRVDISVLWTDKEGKRNQIPAQKWVRHMQSKKELEYSWVFGGSGFFVDEQTKEKFYQAETGDLICVSNFPTATLDLPVESSQANAQLEFEAFTERIPPVGTQVRLVLTVVPEGAAKPEAGAKPEGAAKKDGGEKKSNP